VLDPLEDLFPVNRDVLRCFDSETNLRSIHPKDRHDDVRTDPNDFANSSREYQHVSTSPSYRAVRASLHSPGGGGVTSTRLPAFGRCHILWQFRRTVHHGPRPSWIRGRRSLFRVCRVVMHFVFHHRAMLLAHRLSVTALHLVMAVRKGPVRSQARGELFVNESHLFALLLARFRHTRFAVGSKR
jgi:hypothetical protein